MPRELRLSGDVLKHPMAPFLQHMIAETAQGALIADASSASSIEAAATSALMAEEDKGRLVLAKESHTSPLSPPENLGRPDEAPSEFEDDRFSLAGPCSALAATGGDLGGRAVPTIPASVAVAGAWTRTWARPSSESDTAGSNAVAAPAAPNENGSAHTTAWVTRSFNQGIDGLLSGVRWAGTQVSYSDPDSRSDYQASHPEVFNGLQQVSAAQMVGVHFALNGDRYSQPAGAAGFSVEGFTSLAVDYAGSGSGDGTIRVVNTWDPGTAYAYYPDSGAWGGDVFFGSSGRSPVMGNYDWHTVLHELGHALGLKHGQETGTFGAMPRHLDSMEYSVMTYRSYVGQSARSYENEPFGFAQAFMMYDIAALQHMYGADYSTNAGDTTYKWSPSSGSTFVDGLAAITPGANRIFMTVWDGGGTDMYDLSAYSTNLSIDLGPGGHSVFSAAQLADLDQFTSDSARIARGNVFNALLFQGSAASLIENAIGGSGDDQMIGNQADNTLTGNGGADSLHAGAGNDILIGGAGADHLAGGAGDDVYVAENAGDKVVEAAGGGVDQVNAWVSFTLAAEVENLSIRGSAALNGTGNDLANRITGNGAANSLSGLGGNDTLVGAGGNDTIEGGDGDDILIGGAGLDALAGGAGNDIYVIESTSDTVSEAGNGGIDQVNAWASFTLTAQIENLVLKGSSALNGAGNLLANQITGNRAANKLNGRVGDDTLAGEAGNDTLRGGLGNDTLTGGAGADDFVLDVSPKAANGSDRLTDFVAGTDRLVFQDAVFTELLARDAGGQLRTGQFCLGTAAADASDFLVYTQSTGQLSYDADGSGSNVQVLIATLNAGQALSADNVFLI